MFLIIIQGLFLLLPAYAANAAPILLARFQVFEKWNRPVDFGFRFMGEPVFGPTKTWRGIIGGIFVACAIVFAQVLLNKFAPSTSPLFLFPYQLPDVLFYGFLQGFGEGFGDLIKSFIKRRLHIKNTAPFFPFDQSSFLGALVASFLFYIPDKAHLIAIIVISPFLPVLANIIAYKLGWKKVWW